MRINTAYTLFGLLSVCLAGAVITSCRGIEPITPSTGNEVTGGSEAGEVKGFFLLNEGNMGSNKATLDYFDYTTGVYTRNIFAERNPGVALELGDVGNDLGIYGGRLYAVINCSNLVEVMDVETARHIAEIPLPNCRYIAFDGGYAYVSSYAGAVEFDPEYRRGYVAKIDTVTMQVVDTCGVGYQPEEMAVVDGRLYVANSGGYMAPHYDLTVTVIDLATFEVCNEIEVAPNLHQVKIGGDGMLYISSRGDYYGHQSSTWVVDPSTDEVVRELQLLQNSDMAVYGDSLYVISHSWSNVSLDYSTGYAVFDTREGITVTRNFVTDGTEEEITTPYCIAVNPSNGDIFLTDAKDHVTPGRIHCYGQDGVRKWSATTGDIPGHIVFTSKPLKSL